MRFTVMGFLLLAGVGCNAFQHSERGECAAPGVGCPPANQVGGACPTACPPHAQPCGAAPPTACAPQAPPCPPKEQPREVPAPERVSTRAAVTQDILLIPRMVYVPYAPQVPVAPARVGMVAPAERVVTETTREALPPPREALPQPREAPPLPREACPAPRDRSADTLDRCAELLEKMESRIRFLEEQRPGCPKTSPYQDTVVPEMPIQSNSIK